MLLETINFDASMNNLLAWEKSMLYDLGQLFRVNKKYYSINFKDIVLFNKDVRAVLDDEGQVVFAYSFVTPHKILFFTDSQVLKVVISKNKDYVRK